MNKLKQYINKFLSWFNKDSIISEIKETLQKEPSQEIISAKIIREQTTKNLNDSEFIKTIFKKIHLASKKGIYNCSVKFNTKVPSNIIQCLIRKGYKVYTHKHVKSYEIKIYW